MKRAFLLVLVFWAYSYLAIRLMGFGQTRLLATLMLIAGMLFGLHVFVHAEIWAHRLNNFLGCPHPDDCSCGGVK